MSKSARPIHAAEDERLTALASLAILDTPGEREFDEITRLAALALGAESCAISLIDDARQWFKSRYGIEATETPRAGSFCTHTLESRTLVEVPDTLLDDRFVGNAFVTCDDGIRFYAGAPLIIGSGHCLGTLCVFDRAPRTALSEPQRQALADLARLTVALIESRRHRQIGDIATQVLDVTSDAVLCIDDTGLITFWNRAAEVMFGHAASAALGATLDLILPESHAAAHHAGFARAVAGDPPILIGKTIELSARRADDSVFPIELSLARWGQPGSDNGFAAIIRDTTGRKALERNSEQARAFLNTVVDSLPAMLFVKDAETRRYLLLNRAGEALIGRRADTVVGRTDRELFPDAAMGYEAHDALVLNTGVVMAFEGDLVRPDGETLRLRTKRLIVDGVDTPRQYILGMSEDVTDIRNAEARVAHLANFDSLTGLLNRGSVVDRLGDLVAADTRMALLSIDLDRFKTVNDQFGHLVGDAVLAEAGQRLRRIAGPTDTIARVGGDEFLMIIVDDAPAEHARKVAAIILLALAEPFVTERATVYLGGSIGIVVAPEDGRTPEALRQGADLALYRAKDRGRGTVCFFSADMDAAVRDRRVLESDLRAAIDEDQITLAYQPVLSVATGQITSLEALARWTHPTRGPIAPDLFVSIAEECGLIETLGARILCRACETATTWPEDIRVAVNLSPLQFQTGDLFATVADILATTGLAAHRLQLEVTEGLLIRDVDRTFAELARLRALGIQILMDDFGTGYSSLSYFERFPFDKVKIDQSFVAASGHSRAARAIIHAVVGLGRTLDMGVVAEGVETDAQMAFLTEAGCTHVQGYLFSRPVSAIVAGGLLRRGDPLPSAKAVASRLKRAS